MDGNPPHEDRSNHARTMGLRPNELSIPRGLSPTARSTSPMTAPIPTTPHRTVRFDLDTTEEDTEAAINEEEDTTWTDREDFLYSDGEDEPEYGGHRAPLLTGIEAPAVTLAMDPTTEEVLEGGRPKSGMGMAFFNMSNSIIGAGIIGQPYAFRQAGLGMGLVLLVALTITVDWTINLIVINSKLSGTDSFQATVSACFGKSGLVAISVAQWAFAFGGMVAFCIIIGDTIPHVMGAIFPNLHDIPILWLFTNRKACIVIFTLGISYPLSLYRDISKLAKASAFALLSMMIIVFTVVTQSWTVPEEDKGELTTPMLTVNSGVFQAIGVISFAFVCHHNSLLIYGSLRKPTLDRFATVTHYSTSISLVACLIMALGGFLTFKDKTDGNVLNNFSSGNAMVNIARLFFGLNMLTTLPLEAFVCREVMENYYFPHEPFNPNRHLIFTTALVFTATSLALLTCDLGTVFELIGATSACALAYILPPLCYIKLSTRSWKTIPAAGVVVFGCTVMGISLLQGVWKVISNEGGTKICA